MRSHVLARVREQNGEWIAEAFHGEGVFCMARGLWEAAALQELRAKVDDVLAVEGKAWFHQWRGSPGAPNCPEGAIKLPIDLWICKLVNQTCPIQAQVFLDEPERFFSGCLAPPQRQRQIFDTVAKGEYDGFHHVPGRYLCVCCEHDGKRTASYHYPWEVAAIEAYSPFVLERDWPGVRSKLKDRGLGLSVVSTALCAAHCKELAEIIDPERAVHLRVLALTVLR